MDRKRKVYAPFSQTSEAGVTQTPVEGYIDVSQMIYPIVNTGVVNEKGQWSGVKSSDTEFKQLGKELQVPNGQAIIAPGGDPGFLDMTGFNDLFFAIKPSNGGDYAIEGVMGPDTNRFANLSPVNAGALLRGSYNDTSAVIASVLADSAEALTADVWNIFVVGTRLKNQKMFQLKITNNSGGNSDIEFAFMRIV